MTILEEQWKWWKGITIFTVQQNRVMCVGLKDFFRGQSDCWISWFEFAFLDILEYVLTGFLLITCALRFV